MLRFGLQSNFPVMRRLGWMCHRAVAVRISILIFLLFESAGAASWRLCMLGNEWRFNLNVWYYFE